MMTMINSKPVVKWVGGKRQLLNELESRLPKHEIDFYVEPFFGGGALFFHLSDRIKESHISDTNIELINLYSAIKNYPFKLIQELKSPTYISNKETYENIRSWDRDKDFLHYPPIKRAARFLYLNKTGFNGLYRVNKKGYCNVPFGKNSKPNFCDEEKILAAHASFKNTRISVRSFTCVQFDFQEGQDNSKSFVYFDPPYIPLTKTSSFTSYTEKGFGMKEQIELRDICIKLNDIGVKWMLSNSSSPATYELYNQFKIEEVYARRTINCNSEKRGAIPELIIRNYEN